MLRLSKKADYALMAMKHLAVRGERGSSSAREIAENVRWDMQRFVGLRRQTDDISMIVARLL